MSTLQKKQRHQWTTSRGDWPGTWEHGFKFPARFSFESRWVYLGLCETRESAVELKRLADGLSHEQQREIAEAPTPGVRRRILERLTS